MPVAPICKFFSRCDKNLHSHLGPRRKAALDAAPPRGLTAIERLTSAARVKEPLVPHKTKGATSAVFPCPLPAHLATCA